MRKVTLNKVKLTLVAALFAIVIAMVGIMTFAKAESDVYSVNDVQDTFQIDGAELIVEGEGGINGLNFTASVSADDYEGLMALVGEENTYASIETGLIIMPGYYIQKYGALGEGALFGENAVYDWAEYTDGEYVYTGSKVRVVNINANDWVKEGGVYTYDGAIVDLYDHNETVTFVSCAYIMATDVNGYKYVQMTDYASTSVALELEEEYSSMTNEQKAWVDANWTRFEAVKGEDVIVDVTGLDSINVFPMDEETPAILANIVLDEEAFIKIGMTEPNGVRFTDAFGKKIEFNENEITEIPVIDLKDGSNLREWTFDILVGDIVVYTAKIDLYSQTAKFVWSEMTAESVANYTFEKDASGQKVKVEKGAGTLNTIDGKEMVTFTKTGSDGSWYVWKPIHSKAYYDKFVGKNLSMTVTIHADASAANGAQILNQGYALGDGDNYIVNPKETTSTSFTRSLDTIITNWDNYVESNWDGVWGNRPKYGMAYAYNLTNGGKFSVGFEISVDVSNIAMKGGDILVDLDNIEDKTAIDFTSYMKDTDVAKINEIAVLAGVTYEMKGYSIADTIAVTDLTKVDVSNAKEAAYILNVKVGDAVLYTATFDLYSATSPVVWAESLTSENVVLRQTSKYVQGAYYTETVNSTPVTDYTITDTVTIGSNSYSGSFVKVLVTSATNLSFDVRALHTKAFYNLKIGDSTKILHLRTYIPDSAGYMQILCGQNNFGMANPYKIRGRQGLGVGKLESIVVSLDNNLLATGAEDLYHTNYYDYWETIEGTNVGMCRPMVTFEITSTYISNSGGEYELYVGLQQSHIVDAGESLATAPAVSTFDLSGETTSVDLINVLPANQHSKFKAMAKAWVGKKLTRYGTLLFTGNGIGFILTIGGQKHCVVPDADGKAMLNLDDYIVAANGTASTDTKVRDLLAEGNNSVTIIGYAPPVVSMGFVNAVTLIPSSTITVIGPAKELAIDLASINLTEAKFTIDANAETHDFTSKISADNQAVLQQIKDAGYELTYVLSYDDQGATVSLTEAEAKNATHEDYTRWQYPDVNYTLEIRVIVDESTSFTVLTGTFEAVYE